MKPQHEVQARWYAARTIPMPSRAEDGVESVLIWMERREGGLWAVGRASDLAQREYPEPRSHDYVFEGYDIEDALTAANEALEDELSASERDGIEPHVKPFLRRDLEAPLNEWFWGRRQD